MKTPEEQAQRVAIARSVLERSTTFTVIERSELERLQKVDAALSEIHAWSNPDSAVRMHLPKRTLSWLDEVRRKIEMELSK